MLKFIEEAFISLPVELTLVDLHFQGPLRLILFTFYYYNKNFNAGELLLVIDTKKNSEVEAKLSFKPSEPFFNPIVINSLVFFKFL
jgi:hypothetical protein